MIRLTKKWLKFSPNFFEVCGKMDTFILIFSVHKTIKVISTSFYINPSV